MTKTFTHLNDHGAAEMVDVSQKQDTERVAIAEAIVYLPDDVILAISLSLIHI